MTFHDTPLDVDVDLVFNDRWVNISGNRDVREEDGVTITRGGGFDSSRVEPSRASLTLNNRDGQYMPRNPMGPYYGLLQRNHPARVSRRLIEAGFAATVSNAWPDTDTGQAWTTFGSGGTVQASDWSSASGVGRHSVPVDNAHRQSYLSTVSHRNIEVLATFQLPFSDVLSQGIRCTIVLRGQSTSEYLHVGVLILSNESIEMTCFDANGTAATPTVATGIVHTGQQLRLCACIDGETVRGKIWPANEDEPGDWMLDSHIDEARLISEPGWIGLRTGVLNGNTNTKPIIVSWDDFVVRSPRIYGVVPDWPPEWDTSLNDSYAPIEIAGITRRLDDNDSPLQSALRRSIPNAPGLIAYWPCEDGRDATQLASALPNAGPMDIAGGVPNLASFNDFKASSPLPTVNSSRWGGTVSDFAATGAIQTRYLMAVPSGGTVADAIISQTYSYAGGSATVGLWEVIYRTGGALAVRAWTTSGAIAFTSSDFGFGVNGKLLRVSLELQQDGADVDWSLSTLEVGAETAAATGGTLAAHTLGGAVDIRIAVGNVLTDVAFGHIMVQSQITVLEDLWEELNAYAGETAGRRLERLCEEESLPFAYIGDLDTTAAMGPQLPGQLLDLFEQCVEADRGRLYETRTAPGYTYITLAAMYSRLAAVTLSVADRQVSPPFDPDDDTSRVYNDITVERPDGSSVRAVQEDGPLAVSIIGRKDRKWTVNLEKDIQLPDTATWIRHTNAFDDASFRSIAVNLSRLSGNDALSRAVLDLDLAERITIEDTTALKIYADIEQLLGGYTEYLSTFEHTFQWHTTPERPYHVLTLDDELGRLDSNTSTLNEDLDTTETSVEVTTSDTTRWITTASHSTHFPFNIEVGGEVMEVTAITGTGAVQTFTVVRSVNQVVKEHLTGAAVHVADPVYLGR